VEFALSKAGAILSFLQAPYDPEMVHTGQMPGPLSIPSGGGLGWPGGGAGGWPGSGGSGIPGGGTVSSPMDPNHSAGTETIAQDSGGDTMSLSDASALENTLDRLRQRYLLHFYMSENSLAKTQHSIRVDLATDARILNPEADIRSRRVFIGGSKETMGQTVVTHQTEISDPIPGDDGAANTTPSKHKRVAVNEDDSGSAGSSVGPPE
jgi:hypothetical protein